MSQSMKRNAEEAFPGPQSEAQNKRRRRKNRKVPAKHETVNSDDNVPATKVSALNSPGTKTSVSKSSHTSGESKLQSAQDGIESPATSEKRKGMRKHPSEHSTQPPDDTTSAGAKRVAAKKIEPSSEKQSKKNESKEASMQLQTLPVEDVVEERALVHKSKSNKSKHITSAERITWRFSRRTGGIFINHDPILTDDHKYLILLTRHDVHVYSATTSLLVRTINVTDRADIRACVVSVADREHIYVGMRNGSLVCLDWTTGRKIRQYKVKAGILHISTAGTEGESENLLVIAAQDKVSELLQVTLDSKSSNKSVNSLLQLDYIHDHVVTSADASTIVVFGRDTIHCGQSSAREQSTFMLRQYSWNELETKGRIVSCDARIVDQPTKCKSPPSVDVAVGLQNGAILVYSGLLNKILPRPDSTQLSSNLGRRLHWHRTAVRALKWSRDGNYLVSGGDESVLVIWQLDTNQKQFLPHLSTSVLNITISQSGAHYALRLGDNSVMVLSTADLSPSTNITGLAPLGDNGDRIAVLHPTKPNLLLLAASVRAVGAKSTGEATHLQTYDVDAGLQIGRQALTRNFITAVNVAPDGHTLHEPNVTHVRLTSDGTWLATADEWSPDEADVEFLQLQEDAESPLQEHTLRIWKWKTEDNSWTPTVKIENPHTGPGLSILAMAANPVKSEYATIAEDGSVKIWSPKVRVRNGIAIKDKQGEVLYNWSCSSTSQIENTNVTQEARIGAMAYSQDGSVIAAYLSSDSGRNYVHLIDSKSGSVVLSQQRLVPSMHAQLQFCGRFLIVLSDNLVVFDTITSQASFNLTLGAQYTGERAQKHRLLSVNASASSIAIGVNSMEKQKPKSLITIFDLDHADFAPRAELTVSGHIRALLADSAGSGFVAVDSEAGLRRLTPTTGAIRTNLAGVSHDSHLSAEQEQLKSIEDVFGKYNPDRNITSNEQKLLTTSESSSGQTLDEVVKRAGNGGPISVNDLFENIARAVSNTVRVVA